MKKTIALVAGTLLISLLILTGCKSKVTLVGSWDHEGYVYTFNEDKTGSYSQGTNSIPFTYEDDGSMVTIKYVGSETSNKYNYRIEKNVLIIKDNFDEDVKYTKKK